MMYSLDNCLNDRTNEQQMKNKRSLLMENDG